MSGKIKVKYIGNAYNRIFSRENTYDAIISKDNSHIIIPDKNGNEYGYPISEFEITDD